MIKDKTPAVVPPPETEGSANTTVPEVVEENTLAQMYLAVKRAVLTIREREEDPDSPPFFKTVAIDNGQFNRIVLSENTETEIVFPAVFVHYTNVRYLVQQQRIGQGRAVMRVRFILNTLNNQDADAETVCFNVFQRVNQAIQDAKNHEPSLNERCQLLYFDMPTTTNMLQAYWIDYEVWFWETSAWTYRNWVERYVVMPPFTDHSDAPEHDTQGHGDHKKPTDRQVITIQPSVGEEDTEHNTREL
ncbi:hypothetical protein [Alistipes indistinctus]|uniref:hypothetical protein n=1 Tax=Alistipes indistinctus TaxID=626932 RepID=UPI002052DE9F|nr:MAG TPA: hypothetical protein [Caudoviricetes sp.]